MSSHTAVRREIIPVEAPSKWDRQEQLACVTVDLDAAEPHWPARHPGVFDAAGGFVAHRITAVFSVDEPAVTSYGPDPGADGLGLELDFVAERGPCPDLELVLDERHRGIFHPVVERPDRSRTGEPGPVAGAGKLTVFLPREWLTPGGHALSVTTVIDEASALGERGDVGHTVRYRPTEDLPPARQHYGSWFGSYLRWTRIVLTDVSAPDRAMYAVRPTPFFVSTAAGERELVDLDLCWPAGAPVPSGLELRWGEVVLAVPAVPADRDFGMFRWRFPAPSDVDRRLPVRLVTPTGAVDFAVSPSRRWTLHLIPHVHLDLGFTDTQGKVLELHCRNIDKALDLVDDDPDFRFCVDGSIIVDQFTQTRSPAQVRRLREAAARGVLGVNSFHSNFLTGLTSLAELFRSADLALTLPRSSATSMRYANLTDVPTSSRAIPSVLTQLGIDGFVQMSNHGRAATRSSDELSLLSPVNWEGPDGSRVLAFFADHYSQLRFLCGDPQSLAGGVNGLQRLLSRYERPDYQPSDLPVIGTHADNEDLADGDSGFVRRWNATFAFPRFRISTFDEYLAAVAPLRPRLPVWRAESGTFWEDGAGSAAAEFATYRRAQALLPVPETLGAALSARDGRYRAHRTELDRAWSNLSVAAEHTLTWARATSHPHASAVADQLDWKRRRIHDAHRIATDQTRQQLGQLAEIVGAVAPGYLAYNPHPWTADLEAELDLAEESELTGAGGETMAIETLSSCAGLRRVRVALAGMPPHSYRFLPLTAGADTVPGGEQTARARSSRADPGYRRPADLDGTIRTASWTVELDLSTSLPRSLRRCTTGRELLDPDAGVRLGQLIRSAADAFPEPNEMTAVDERHEHHRARIEQVENYATPGPPRELIQQSPVYHFLGAKETFDGARLRWIGAGCGLHEITVDLLLRDVTGCCDVEVSFVKEPCLDMEAVYVAFPFAGADPILRHDRQLGWVEPVTDHGPGAANEWSALTDVVAIHSGTGGIWWTSLDAPLFTAGDIVRGRWPDLPRIDNGHLYSWVMNNFWPCNTPPAQQGPVRFQYRFVPVESFEPAAATRFGRTARVGAQVSEVTPLDRFDPTRTARYLEGQLLTLGVDQHTDAGLRQTTEDRMELRLTNLSPAARIVTVTLPAGFVRPSHPRPADDSSSGAGAGPIEVSLPGYGTVEFPLTRR